MNDETRDESFWPPAELPSRDLDEPPPGLESAILRRAHGVMRQRRLVRRAWLVAALVLVYAGGFWSAEMFRGEPSQPSPESATEHIAEVGAPPAFEMKVAAQTDQPRELELLASLRSSDRAELLRRAGDLYLEQGGDISGALRCYRELLELEPSRTAGHETWLLAALRQDRF